MSFTKKWQRDPVPKCTLMNKKYQANTFSQWRRVICVIPKEKKTENRERHIEYAKRMHNIK